jgi:hypothetical protein
LAVDGECNRSENLTSLGLNLASILLPGVTGLGAASRVGLRGGESAAAALGRLKHAELASKVKAKGWKSNPSMVGIDGKTYRPDIVTPRGRILEYKPNTTSGRAQGARQAKNYSKQLEKRVRVIYYDP